MTDTPSGGAAEAVEGVLLPLPLLLFVGSGCAALIYEVVWFQMLQLVIGSTGVSLGVLLGSFMGGMCIGSLALPRLVSRESHPLAVYARLEIAIAVCGVLLLGLVPLVGRAYLGVAPSGGASVFLRALLAVLLLMPPTVLMGATLPAIARYVETTPEGVSWMGFFYGGNIAGAVLGCLLAGFYLLRQFDVVVASLVAVALNLAVALMGWMLSRRTTPPQAEEEREPPALTVDRHGAILVAIALSGFVALGSQVVWTRLMSLTLGATTYTFSIILAVFLAALGIGSTFGSYLSRHVSNPRTLFAGCQAGAAIGIAWSAYVVALQLPYWPINPSITDDPSFVFQLDLVRAVWAILPAPLFWGASFPLAVAAAAERGQDPAALLGRVYAANTVGAIAGALLFGVVAIPWLGSRDAQRVLIVLSAASSLLLIMPWLRPAGRLVAGRVATIGLGGVGIAAVVASVTMVPPVLVAYGRFSATYDTPTALYVGEGRNSSIAVTELSGGVRNIHIGGKIVASTEPQDMRLQGMLGHLTALLHDDPRSVLIVGFGAGVTAGTFVTHPGIDRIVIVEIEPLVVRESSGFFSDVNHDVLADPRVEVVFDDARHYLQTTDETFDLITSDPIHPWMKGAAALYSEEYFELVADRLEPGGVVTQWVPLYESTTEAVKSEMATFLSVFPEGTVWGNTYDGGGYDVVMAARPGGGPVDVDVLEDRLRSVDHARVAIDLGEVGFGGALDLLSTYAAGASDLAPWLVDAEINRDRSLRLMYLAGLGLNRYDASGIYSELLEYRRYPDGLFVGSAGRLEMLRSLMRFR